MNTTKKKNNIPLRRCIVTGEQLPKAALIRIVKTPDQRLAIDMSPSGKMNGRGAYIKKDANIINMLKKGQFTKKNLDIDPSDDFYQQLETFMHG